MYGGEPPKGYLHCVYYRSAIQHQCGVEIIAMLAIPICGNEKCIKEEGTPAALFFYRDIALDFISAQHD